MESRVRILLLTAALTALPGCASLSNWIHHRHQPNETQEEAGNDAAQSGDEPDDSQPPRVIQPEVERRNITVPKIHGSNIELGLEYGALSIEDFGTNAVYAATLAYHINEDVFLQAEVGRSEAGKTSYETETGNTLYTHSQRMFTYYDLSLGYNFLPGEAYIGRGRALTSYFYLLGGIGSTNFISSEIFTVNFGAGYKLLPADNIAVHIQVQDRIFQSDLLGLSKLTNNFEAVVGASYFF